MPQVIDAAQSSKGDIIISVGRSGHRATLIRVHSASLKITSPLFRVMLGPNFIEGSTTYTDESPLRLKGDDAEAMLDLCTLLHHQKASKIPLSRFPKLVALADKYQCVETVVPWFMAAMNGCLVSCGGISKSMYAS